MIGSRAVAIALVLAAVGASGVAVAAPRDSAREPSPADLQQARELFSKAERDERARDWKSALEKLERAGAIKMTPGIRFHIALCHENLAMLVEALADYEAASQQARSEGVAEVLEAAREPLANLRARVPALSLAIEGAPVDNVDVSIDDQPIATSALAAPIRLTAGIHHIVARRRDGRSFTKDVELHERDTVALDLTIPPEAEANGSAERKPRPPPLAPPEEPSGSRSRTSAAFATAGAIVLVGGGVAAFVLAGASQHDLRSCISNDDCNSKRNAVRTWDALALTGWIAGAAAGTFATVLWLQSSRAAAPARVVLAPSLGGVSLAGNF